MPSVPEALALGWKHQQAGELRRAEQIYRQIIQADPRNGDAFFSLGDVYQATGRLRDAVASYRDGLRFYPSVAKAHNNLGSALAGLGQFDEAIRNFEEAIRLVPAHAGAHSNLGNALRDQRRAGSGGNAQLLRAEQHVREALRLQPEFADAHNNLGNILRDQGRFAEAEACFAAAVRFNPRHANAHKNLGIVLLETGRLREGWPEYEWRWESDDTRRSFPQPAWDGSPLAGRTILLHAEQGMGDTIQFIRYAALLRNQGARVIVECQKSLLPLVASCAGIDQLVGHGDPLPAFDVQAALLSVPRLVGTKLDSIPTTVPYLQASAAVVRLWQRELAPIRGLKVGIAWQGNPIYRGDRQRSIPLAAFARLARIGNVRLISLQKGPGIEQLQKGERASVADLGSRLDNDAGAFMDTAAVLRNLDLVISSDTALPHVAGALGVPVWVALPLVPDWRWLLDREDCPWYPTMRLFRQRELDQWGPVFDEIAAELEKAAATKSRGSPILIEMTPGELADKISILEIKCDRITDPEKLAHVRAEVAALREAQAPIAGWSEQAKELTAELRRVNQSLWDIENALRACERAGDFSACFIELARSVYRQNDRRAQLKRQMNEMLGARFAEQKCYTAY
jgi:Tfp pilus assembly protein PilF